MKSKIRPHSELHGIITLKILWTGTYSFNLDSRVRGNDEHRSFLILHGFIETVFHFLLWPRGHGGYSIIRFSYEEKTIMINIPDPVELTQTLIRMDNINPSGNTARGKSAHGSMPDLGDNAIYPGSRILSGDCQKLVCSLKIKLPPTEDVACSCWSWKVR